MTAAQILFYLFIVALAWGALNNQSLRKTRKERDMYQRDANHNFAVADAAQARVERLGKELVGSHVALDSAQKYAAEMQRQRDDMQRRLAQATAPRKVEVVS